MDNLAHTLAGLALAEAGLKRKTALATATLAIAANLPDVDALIYFVGDGPDALAFRRGWTHGPIAIVVLPLLLTLIMMGWSRLRGGPPHRKAQVKPGWLFVVALIGVLSHPLLDLMNSYGVRLLMPFSDRWFYGDALFIIDPWLWLALAIGIVVARWRGRRTRDAATGVALARGRSSREVPTDALWVTRPARVAIMLLVIYAGVMVIGGHVGRQIVERQAGDPAAVRTMAGPVAVTPFRRQVVRDLGESYESGELTFGLRPRYSIIGRVEQRREAAGVAAAAQTHDGAAFLTWARFPYFMTEQVGDSIRVRMSDARYADALGRGWASVVVTVPASGP